MAWVSGEIDIANSAPLAELCALALADARVDALVLDVSRVSFIDSTGLSAVIQLRNQAEDSHKRLALRGVTPAVAKILTLTVLDEMFGLSVDDAGRC